MVSLHLYIFPYHAFDVKWGRYQELWWTLYVNTYIADTEEVIFFPEIKKGKFRKVWISMMLKKEILIMFLSMSEYGSKVKIWPLTFVIMMR